MNAFRRKTMITESLLFIIVLHTAWIKGLVEDTAKRGISKHIQQYQAEVTLK